jgi:hypothetical protein
VLCDDYKDESVAFFTSIVILAACLFIILVNLYFIRRYKSQFVKLIFQADVHILQKESNYRKIFCGT